MIFRLYDLLTLMTDCVEKKIGKNDAIAMLLAVKKTFFSQTQSKQNLYDLKEDNNMKPRT